jgi:hypothetical protein
MWKKNDRLIFRVPWIAGDPGNARLQSKRADGTRKQAAEKGLIATPG